MHKIGFIILGFLLTGCSSYFKRQSCEATNWFDYGQKVALEGRRLTGDAFVTECLKAEADVAEADLDRGFKAGLEQYCRPDVVFQTGKSGRFFNEEMCVGEGVSQLRLKHAAGVNEYCQRSNGYTAGAQGVAYNKICPASLEKSFLPEFNRGRKSYLQTIVTQNEKQIYDHEREANRLQNELTYKKGILVGLQARAATSNATNNTDLNAQIGSINSEVSNLSGSIRSLQQKINSLKARNREIQIEMVQLAQ